ncbi:MAG: PEP-CTERM system histidine kinase PrsK [Alphaproteobacteria bacterium]|nr:MAG: PEP-CTERM system histidine kinase PrsK [Alphaproteobacteria bacterium]
MADLIIQGSYLICALAFAGLAGLALMTRTRSRQFFWLVMASLATVIWALIIWGDDAAAWTINPTLTIWLEVARSLAWIVFLIVITGLSRRGAESWVKQGVAFGLIVPLALLGYVTVADLLLVEGLSGHSHFFLSGLSRLTLSILGLFLLENLFRNADIDQRWATKYLCIGLGLVFAYEFFFYAEAVIFNRMSEGLFDARGYVIAFAAPLIAISVSRAKYWTINLHVSRTMVFHTAAVMGTGIYLLAISAAGYYVAQIGGDAGSVFQTVFLSLAIVLLVSLFASGSLRARLRGFISDNFYSVKYDYREEWLRFIGTLSASEEDQSLNQRIVTAIASIFESTAALLWVLDARGEAFHPEVSWNFEGDIDSLEMDHALVGLFVEDPSIRQVSKDDTQTASFATINDRPVSFLVPLIHEGILQGILALGQPRANRDFGHEDQQLLETVSQQAASYIAEARAAAALSQVQKLEEFNERFAFIAHDMKNIVNQLSIMVQNARVHGENPEFQKDMINTVANSVARMKSMMADLTAVRERSSEAPLERVQMSPVALDEILRQVADDWQKLHANMKVDLPEETMLAQVDEKKLRTALGHILQNAWDAVGEKGAVSFHGETRDQQAILDISDDGPGMSREFIQNIFFQPFKSTKKGGYGIGGFQIRQLVREMGGKLDVHSEPGQGTTVRVTLPLTLVEMKAPAEKAS